MTQDCILHLSEPVWKDHLPYKIWQKDGLTIITQVSLYMVIKCDILTGYSLVLDGAHICDGQFGFFHGLCGSWAARQTTMGQKAAVRVTRPVTARGGTSINKIFLIYNKYRTKTVLFYLILIKKTPVLANNVVSNKKVIEFSKINKEIITVPEESLQQTERSRTQLPS